MHPTAPDCAVIQNHKCRLIKQYTMYYQYPIKFWQLKIIMARRSAMHDKYERTIFRWHAGMPTFGRVNTVHCARPRTMEADGSAPLHLPLRGGRSKHQICILSPTSFLPFREGKEDHETIKRKFHSGKILSCEWQKREEKKNWNFLEEMTLAPFLNAKIIPFYFPGFSLTFFSRRKQVWATSLWTVVYRIRF